jgi:hypothetical protein
MKTIRKLSPDGLRKFHVWLDGDRIGSPPVELLERNDASLPVPGNPVIDDSPVHEAFHLAKRVIDAFGNRPEKLDGFIDDFGFWSGLALALHQSLGISGSSDMAHRYCAGLQKWRTRHKIYVPTILRLRLGDDAERIMSRKIGVNDVMETIVRTPELLANHQIIRAYGRLLGKFGNERLLDARNATEKLQSIDKIMNQLRRNYDLGGMTADEITALVPETVKASLLSEGDDEEPSFQPETGEERFPDPDGPLLFAA